MKIVNGINLLAILVILAICFSLSLPAICAVPSVDRTPNPGITLPCKILSVHDGDTLKVECRFQMDIRLLDCWAPEITGDEKPDGLISKEALRKLVDGKEGFVTVPLTSENIGKATSMSRVLGRVVVDGVDLSEQQVRGKFATKEKGVVRSD